MLLDKICPQILPATSHLYIFISSTTMAGIIGKKLEMTRVIHNGKFTPVTLIKVPTLTVAQVKTLEIDGYEAIVIRMTDGKKVTLREVPRTGAFTSLEKDTEITLDMLDGVAEFTVSSISKGKGFAGAMKRWNFKGMPGGHGHKYTRSLGSIGTRKPRRTKLGKKMHGHMGLDQITLKNIPLVLVNKELRVIGVKGPIAGARNSLVTMTF
ncbi:50S ribosomal protein L3 [Candidatus Gracilibacteria bacterium]|nr:50S ribosomal protein L3 [Candidatus Gracilibacteria bacterium]